jgi:hypothetical protein
MRTTLLILATLAAFATRARAESKTAPRKGPYEVKSGTIVMTNSMIEGSTTTIYFDDYGARRATLTSMHTTVMGQPINNERWQIVADGAITNYDAVKKTGTRRKLGDRIPPPAGMSMPDPKTLSGDMKKREAVRRQDLQGDRDELDGHDHPELDVERSPTARGDDLRFLEGPQGRRRQADRDAGDVVQ